MDDEMKDAILELIKEKLQIKVNVLVGSPGYIKVDVELSIEDELHPFAWSDDCNHIEIERY